MNGHVEVVRLEVVSHFSEALQTVFPHCLLKAKRLPGFTALLSFVKKKKNIIVNTDNTLKKKHINLEWIVNTIFAINSLISSFLRDFDGLTSATHFGQRQSPLGTSCRGGMRQKVW